MEYYKKIDKSFFQYGITIPQKYISIFLCGVDIPLGESREITLYWKKTKYSSRLNHVNIKGKKPVYQLRWDNSPALKASLKTEFIQSYIAIVSQNYTANYSNEYYVTKLKGGNQEVAVFEPVSSSEISLSTFIKIETPYDELFKKLISENVFGWLSKEDNKQMITKHTKWIDISELSKHQDVPFVIYYLLDNVNKEIYIGSAKKLGDRVKPSRKEIPGWNKFRYEIIHPLYHNLIKEIEYHSIMNFARFFKNSRNLSSVEISEYLMVNKDYKYYRE